MYIVLYHGQVEKLKIDEAKSQEIREEKEGKLIGGRQENKYYRSRQCNIYTSRERGQIR